MLIKTYKLSLIILTLCILSLPAYSADWKITLKVSGGGTYDYCIAGVKEGATDGLDNAWDIPSPPDNLNNTYIFAYFPHPEWDSVFNKFRQDIKAPDLPKEWIFEIESNISGNLTITWPDIKSAIPDKEAVLVDIDGDDSEINMQTSSSFVFFNDDNPRRFLVRVSEIPVPLPPEGLMGKAVRSRGKWSVSLYWSQNTESDITGYNIYRSTTSGSAYKKMNDSLISESEYTDKQITKNRAYYYVVTAVNTSGRENGYSNEIEVIVGKIKVRQKR
jgi:hypothetical protein